MGWDRVGNAAPDDNEITPAQQRMLQSLAEKIDGVTPGMYGSLTYKMTRLEASREIDKRQGILFRRKNKAS